MNSYMIFDIWITLAFSIQSLITMLFIKRLKSSEKRRMDSEMRISDLEFKVEDLEYDVRKLEGDFGK